MVDVKRREFKCLSEPKGKSNDKGPILKQQLTFETPEKCEPERKCALGLYSGNQY